MSKYSRSTYVFWGIFIGLALMRLIASARIRAPDISDCLKKNIESVGVIVQEPERKESGQVFIIKSLDICGAELLVRVKTKLYPVYRYGDRVKFAGKISKPFNFRSNDGRSFDYEGYLAKDNVFYEMKSARIDLFELSNRNSSHENGTSSVDASNSWFIKLLNSVPYGLYSLKRGFVSNLENVLGEPHAALAAGLVVGEKSALGKELIDDFRTVGLIHIVVLSGYNITIVADSMRRMLVFLPRIWGIIIGGVGIASFGILVGGGATVVRSCVMASIALMASLIRRDYNVGRALAFAGLIMLIQNPLILLHDPSFQLSFLATMGLMFLSSPIEGKLLFIPEKFGMRGIVASTIATQIFVSPYILYMMGQISIIGMVVNILVLPFIPVTMLFVFVTGILGYVSYTLSYATGLVAHRLLSYELFMVEQFARIPFASAHVSQFSFWYVVCFYVVFTIVFLYRKELLEKFGGFRNNIILFNYKWLIQLGLLSDTNKIIPVYFNTFTVKSNKNRNQSLSVFTRYSYKHVLEKISLVKKILNNIKNVIENPDEIRNGHVKSRLMLIKTIKNETRSQVVVIETVLGDNNYDFIIVTSFFANKKYLSGFELLWRTEILQNKMVPPSHIHIK